MKKEKAAAPKNLTGKTPLLQNKNFTSLLASFIAIALGLLVGYFILLAANPAQAINGFTTILKGGFAGGNKGLGNVLYLAVPVMMTGLGVAFAFKTGIFNIGGPGQFVVGGFAAILVAAKFGNSLPGPLAWVLPLVASLIFGALWTLIPGFLNAYANVNVVIGSIMMNYIGMYLVNYLIPVTGVYDSTRNQTIPLPRASLLPKGILDTWFKGSSANISIFIAIGAAVAVHILLNKTTFGYELRACGLNKAAGRYAGINEKRNIILSLMISGALVGLGGGLTYLAPTGKYIIMLDSLAAEGFNGIPVALLALNSPLGVIFSALFIGYITVGGFYMQLYGFVPEIVDIIIASIIYFSALALVVRGALNRIALRRTGGPAAGGPAAVEPAVVQPATQLPGSTGEGEGTAATAAGAKTPESGITTGQKETHANAPQPAGDKENEEGEVVK